MGFDLKLEIKRDGQETPLGITQRIEDEELRDMGNCLTTAEIVQINLMAMADTLVAIMERGSKKAEGGAGDGDNKNV